MKNTNIQASIGNNIHKKLTSESKAQKQIRKGLNNFANGKYKF